MLLLLLWLRLEGRLCRVELRCCSTRLLLLLLLQVANKEETKQEQEENIINNSSRDQWKMENFCKKSNTEGTDMSHTKDGCPPKRMALQNKKKTELKKEK